ncbi:hypothetical protein DFP72DRAFT_1085852 [Ephemerocybe angulata]|uniref:Uncharacterized protein n=1 Tax=Ephemerocybe angulata TaxID=980116 RepID=A0A8H6H5T2_9AGAR|nr:hypothetical protein DFP72DRAFT_1085852 [Tulosesus angulatus]
MATRTSKRSAPTSTPASNGPKRPKTQNPPTPSPPSTPPVDTCDWVPLECTIDATKKDVPTDYLLRAHGGHKLWITPGMIVTLPVDQPPRTKPEDRKWRYLLVDTAYESSHLEGRWFMTVEQVQKTYQFRDFDTARIAQLGNTEVILTHVVGLVHLNDVVWFASIPPFSDALVTFPTLVADRRFYRACIALAGKPRARLGRDGRRPAVVSWLKDIAPCPGCNQLYRPREPLDKQLYCFACACWVHAECCNDPEHNRPPIEFVTEPYHTMSDKDALRKMPVIRGAWMAPYEKVDGKLPEVAEKPVAGQSWCPSHQDWMNTGTFEMLSRVICYMNAYEAITQGDAPGALITEMLEGYQREESFTDICPGYWKSIKTLPFLKYRCPKCHNLIQSLFEAQAAAQAETPPRTLFDSCPSREVALYTKAEFTAAAHN